MGAYLPLLPPAPSKFNPIEIGIHHLACEGEPEKYIREDPRGAAD